MDITEEFDMVPKKSKKSRQNKLDISEHIDTLVMDNSKITKKKLKTDKTIKKSKKVFWF